ncbi:MAG: hypothetical protein IKL16_00235 [Clostridia bacterium]|nr:hypothetical protein [Clostridia bacterium]
MKISKTAFRLLSLLMTFVLIISISGLSAFAADESDYVAEFRIETDKSSPRKDEDIEVSVFLKTNYYICTMSLAILYDSEMLSLQNTSSSLSSFLTFEGSMADTYITNGNWKSPSNFYLKRNSNPSFWSRDDIMNKYKIVYATWSADTSISSELVLMSEEEKVLSFTVKANEDIEDLSELIFMSNDFQKTQTAPQGIFFVGRSTTEEYSISSMVTSGQTLIYHGVDPTKKEPEAKVSFSAKESTATIIDKELGLIYGLEEGIYDLEDFVEYEGGTLEYIESENGFGTGSVVNFIVDGEIYESYTIIIFGDLTGDGVIDTYDTVMMASIVNYDIEFEEKSPVSIAGDISNNDDITDTYDLVYLYRVVNGDSELPQTMEI